MGKSQKILLGIVGAAIILRILMFAGLYFKDDVNVFYLGDTVGYMQIADNLIAGNGYSMATSSPFKPDGMRTPILPYILAVVKGVFGTPVPYVLFQIALSGVIIFLAFKLTLLVTGREKIALGVAAFSAFEPYSIFINMSLLTETIFSVFILGAVCSAALFIENRSLYALAAASALCALAALTRPIAQFLPILLILLVCVQMPLRSYAKYLGVVLGAFLLVLSPWLIRNYETFGAVSISSGGYQNVYSDLGATIISYRDDIPWYIAKQNLNADFALRHHIAEAAMQQDVTWSSTLLKEGLMIMVENPFPTLLSFTTVSLAFLTNDAWSYYPQYWGWIPKYEYGFSPTQVLMSEGPFVALHRVIDATGGSLLIPLGGRLFWFLTSALFFYGAWVLVREKEDRRLHAILLVGIVLYMLALCLSNGAGINGRYRYPINPLLYIGALYALVHLVQGGMVVLKRWKTPV